MSGLTPVAAIAPWLLRRLKLPMVPAPEICCPLPRIRLSAPPVPRMRFPGLSVRTMAPVTPVALEMVNWPPSPPSSSSRVLSPFAAFSVIDPELLMSGRRSQRQRAAVVHLEDAGIHQIAVRRGAAIERQDQGIRSVGSDRTGIIDHAEVTDGSRPRDGVPESVEQSLIPVHAGHEVIGVVGEAEATGAGRRQYRARVVVVIQQRAGVAPLGIEGNRAIVRDLQIRRTLKNE